MSWVSRGRVVQVLAVTAAGLGAVLAACIIADPPTDLPRPAPRKPTIIRSTASPPDTVILGTFPDSTQGQGFHVEVDADPNATTPLSWRLFLDYDPITNNTDSEIGADTVPVDLTSPTPEIREVDMIPKFPVHPDPTRCHVIEGIVSYPAAFLTSAHAYDPLGGDSITWIYSPTGDLSGCPVFNSGLDGSFRDVVPDSLATGSDGGLD